MCAVVVESSDEAGDTYVGDVYRAMARDKTDRLVQKVRLVFRKRTVGLAVGTNLVRGRSGGETRRHREAVRCGDAVSGRLSLLAFYTHQLPRMAAVSR